MTGCHSNHVVVCHRRSRKALLLKSLSHDIGKNIGKKCHKRYLALSSAIVTAFPVAV